MCEPDFKKEAEKIKKYIKRMFGLTDVKIEIAQTLNGYMGISDRDNREIKLTMGGAKYPVIIWHEIGHIMAKKHKPYPCIFNEVEAQLWSMRLMKKKGYNKMYRQEIKEVKWWLEGKGIQGLLYKKAGKIILKRLGEDN